METCTLPMEYVYEGAHYHAVVLSVKEHSIVVFSTNNEFLNECYDASELVGTLVDLMSGKFM